MPRSVLTSLTLAAILAPSAALPCGNAIYLDTDEATRLIAKAEKAIEEGRYQEARRSLYGGEVRVSSETLMRRIRVLSSVADLRLGYITSAAWSLDFLNQENPKDTYVATRLGEVLERLGTTPATKKGLEILSALERKDLVADEHGFRALAALADRSGDPALRDRALARCRAMAKDRSFCTIDSRQKKRRPTEDDPRFPQS